uniref:Uncharacterized protein n=1 Tax=Rhizophora mucronata TaxID=61149 RepID=A0A2P2PJ21_RHIMU
MLHFHVINKTFVSFHLSNSFCLYYLRNKGLISIDFLFRKNFPRKLCF